LKIDGEFVKNARSVNAWEPVTLCEASTLVDLRKKLSRYAGQTARCACGLRPTAAGSDKCSNCTRNANLAAVGAQS